MNGAGKPQELAHICQNILLLAEGENAHERQVGLVDGLVESWEVENVEFAHKTVKVLSPSEQMLITYLNHQCDALNLNKKITLKKGEILILSNPGLKACALALRDTVQPPPQTGPRPTSKHQPAVSSVAVSEPILRATLPTNIEITIPKPPALPDAFFDGSAALGIAIGEYLESPVQKSELEKQYTEHTKEMITKCLTLADLKRFLETLLDNIHQQASQKNWKQNSYFLYLKTKIIPQQSKTQRETIYQTTLKPLLEELIFHLSKGHSFSQKCTDDLFTYTLEIEKVIESKLMAKAKLDIAPLVTWLKTTEPGCSFTNPSYNEIKFLKLDRNLLENANIIKGYSREFGHPLSTTSIIKFQPEPEELQQLRKEFSDPAVGLPARCAGATLFKQEHYQETLIDFQKRLLANRDLSSMELNQPVTSLFEGAKTKLFLYNGIIFCFSQEILGSPTAIFPQNAFTNAFIGKTIEQVEHLANDEKARGCRRLKTVEDLGNTMLERETYFASLDRQVKAPPYFKASLKGWTTSKAVSAQLLSNEPKRHNENVVSDIIPHAIKGCVHYLAPEHFEAGKSVYWNLGAQLDATQEISGKICEITGDAALLLIIYNPFHGRIQEAGVLHDLIPDHLRYQMFGDYLKRSVKKIKDICSAIGFDRNHMERLMVRAPLKNQLVFLTENPSFFVDGTEKIAKKLMTCAFTQHRPLRAAKDPDRTCQDLLDQFFYCPRTTHELEQCLDSKKLPENLPNRTPPEEAMRSVLACEWYCQLLTTLGIELSEHETLLLLYASLISHAAHRPEDSGALFGRCFSEIFPGEAFDCIKRAITTLQGNQLSLHPRTKLYQQVLRFAHRLPAFCRGELPGQFSTPVTNDFVESKAHLSCLAIPNVLLDDEAFTQLLIAGIHGMIDLSEVTGCGRIADSRDQKHYTERYETAKMTENLNNDRQQKFRTSANLWKSMHAQLRENAKREVCRLAGIKIDHTFQLNALGLPPNFSTLDLVTVSGKTTGTVLAPLVKHIKEHKLARPTKNITVADWKTIGQTPGLANLIDDERKKIPPVALLASIKSPSQAQTLW